MKDGEYACYAGMWFDEINKYAYLEPLATVPEHRRKGLTTVALTEGIKKRRRSDFHRFILITSKNQVCY
ncbi:MAG: GNAT family N-acetyltransferase [Clostridiaceae bacterium]|jgi:predicted acetyltransferase|nr:GNAT family N-acetyltransferase [Clostridiaceae bacterium]